MNPYRHIVQYYETDKMGITHHSNYIRWMEEARIDLLKQLDWDYAKLESQGIISPVVDVSCKYKSPTTFSDEILIQVQVQEYKGVKLILHYEMRKSDGTLAAEGQSSHCFVDQNGRPLRIRKQHPDFHNALTCAWVQNHLTVRSFEEKDAEEVSEMIAGTLRQVNKASYTSEELDTIIAHLQPQDMIQRASWTHTYIFTLEEKIVGIGGIGPYWGSMDESSFFHIFVHKDYQGMHIGHRIIEALEADEFFLRARRVEIPASIDATPFYLKMGYTYKNGITEPDEEKLLRLEKFR